MKINYDLIQEDYLNFNVFHAKNSEAVQGNLKIQRYITPVIFLIIPFFLKNRVDPPFWYWMIWFSITYILWVIFYPRHYYWIIKRSVKKMLKEGKNKGMLGSKTIELNEDNIISAGENSESNVKWSTVERYKETKDYIYIYISAVEAYIVPKRAFKDEKEKEEFIKILDKGIKITI